MQVAQCGECSHTERDSASSMPSMDILILIFPFFSSFCFFFLLRNHLPKGSVVFPFLVSKKSSGALNHLFQSIAFELTISGRFVKEKPRRISLNRIAKEESQYFPYYEKIVMPSTSISRK